jgi:aryl-alcohol dehydrogenase
MKMKAAVMHAPNQPFEIKEITVNDQLEAREVLVKIIATGLCHTDLAVRDQHLPVALPAVLGHEGAGIVEKIGSAVTKVVPGDHVVIAPTSCGHCRYCLSGHPSYCENFFQLNAGGNPARSCPYHDANGNEVGAFFFGQSSFATYSLTTENNLVKVGKEIPIENLGPLGCGLQTGAGTVLNVLQPSPGQSIVIFGIGPVGLAALMAAKASGCTTIIAVDIHDNRLQLSKEIGATHTINSKHISVSKYILENILPEGVYYAVDTTSRNEVINEALASLRFMGTCALVGVPVSATLEVSNYLLSAGRSLIAVVEGDSVPDVLIPQLIDLHKKGLFPFEKLITFYELKDINEAVNDTEKGITIKAVIKMPT